ncbi:MAG: hypothetical protein BWY76_00366 [bacterium ADurb.Bin429]|nr:MAG: hypothetical protein BWY76_00366 [bacterium ADurb.Bin429]
MRFVGGGLRENPAHERDIAEAVEHPGIGGQAVAPRAPRLLIIGFHALRDVQVGDEAHVRLVNAHAEGDGGDDNHPVLALKAVLVALAGGGVHAGVIGQCVPALRRQPVRDLLGLAAGQAVDDAGVARVFGFEKVAQLRLRIRLLLYPVADIGPVKARYEEFRVFQPQLFHDFPTRQRVGGGGERQPGDAGEALVQHGEEEVFLAKIVPPLRNAVRLVYGEKSEGTARKQRQRAVGEQALGRDVKKIEGARFHLLLHPLRFRRGERGVEKGGARAKLAQRAHLVLHKGDERRDDYPHAGTQQRGQLIAQRFAPASGHQHEGIAAGEHPADDRFLLPAKAVVAEDAPQHVAHLVGLFLWQAALRGHGRQRRLPHRRPQYNARDGCVP